MRWSGTLPNRHRNRWVLSRLLWWRERRLCIAFLTDVGQWWSRRYYCSPCSASPISRFRLLVSIVGQPPSLARCPSPVTFDLNNQRYVNHFSSTLLYDRCCSLVSTSVHYTFFPFQACMAVNDRNHGYLVSIPTLEIAGGAGQGDVYSNLLARPRISDPRIGIERPSPRPGQTTKLHRF